jgi:hypothetical protein
MATNPSMKPRVHEQTAGPTEAEIQHEAYRLWLEGGRQEGVELENWLAAKERLRHRGPSAQISARSEQKAKPARLPNAVAFALPAETRALIR